MDEKEKCCSCPKPDFTKSQTYQNLMKAYAGELKADGKYRIYALKAREDGYEQIGNIFDETAGNEQEHAEIWLKWMNNGEVPPTLTNLKDASAGEKEEWKNMYPEFAACARREGYEELTRLFLQVGSIEHSHMDRYDQLIENIQTDQVFCDEDRRTVWICLNCGHLHRGECAPTTCPTCGFPQAFFERRCTNY